MSDDGAFTSDAILGGSLTLRQMRAGHRVGHDAVLLAAAAPAACRRVVDLGAGVGAAGLAFLTRVGEAELVAVEVVPELADLARENAALNAMAARVRVVTADVVSLARPEGPPEPAAGRADLVLMNPPYNAPGAHQASPRARRALAHMADDGLLDAWATAAHRCLEPGGHLCLIHRPGALAPILAALDGRFGAAEFIPVHPRPEAPAARLLVRAVKGRRTGPALLPGLVLTDADGTPAAAAERILRAGEGLQAAP